MGSNATNDDRLVRLTAICLGLPSAEREMMGSHASFRVAGKVFAYYLHDHHGDGIVGLACKLPAGENTALIAASPERFYLPAYVGPRGWVGLRLDRGRVSWNEVGELVRTSYALAAPKRILSTLKSGRPAIRQWL
jgi:hypothetical protein